MLGFSRPRHSLWGGSTVVRRPGKNLFGMSQLSRFAAACHMKLRPRSRVFSTAIISDQSRETMLQAVQDEGNEEEPSQASTDGVMTTKVPNASTQQEGFDCARNSKLDSSPFRPASACPPRRNSAVSIVLRRTFISSLRVRIGVNYGEPT